MRHFPSIGQFRHAVAAVTNKATFVSKDADGVVTFDPSREKPTLTFKGRVKLHGSNGGIRYLPASGEFFAQSRENELSLEADNLKFCAWLMSESGSVARARLVRTLKALMGEQSAYEQVTFFGEWCGASVNSKTAIGNVPETFYVFEAAVLLRGGSEVWVDMELLAKEFYANAAEAPLPDVKVIHEFPSFEVTIDFNRPEDSLEQLTALTLEVERECPVAKARGVLGIGEGLVWSSDTPEFGLIRFKTKGLRHVGTKREGGAIASVSPAVHASRAAFVEAVLTQSRLEQGLDYVRRLNGTATPELIGKFLAWVGTDVLKEESDTLEASGLDRKDVMSSVNKAAKTWYSQVIRG